MLRHPTATRASHPERDCPQNNRCCLYLHIKGGWLCVLQVVMLVGCSPYQTHLAGWRVPSQTVMYPQRNKRPFSEIELPHLPPSPAPLPCPYSAAPAAPTHQHRLGFSRLAQCTAAPHLPPPGDDHQLPAACRWGQGTAPHPDEKQQPAHRQIVSMLATLPSCSRQNQNTGAPDELHEPCSGHTTSGV